MVEGGLGFRTCSELFILWISGFSSGWHEFHFEHWKPGFWSHSACFWANHQISSNFIKSAFVFVHGFCVVCLWVFVLLSNTGWRPARPRPHARRYQNKETLSFAVTGSGSPRHKLRMRVPPGGPVLLYHHIIVLYMFFMGWAASLLSVKDGIGGGGR